ncbi:MAG: Protein phosphatase PrpC [bacterium]|nr:Protein phosphatase PrpC [bacterium]
MTAPLLSSFGLSNRGNVRAKNEDTILRRDELSLFAVADGMGGHYGGEVASRIAIETLLHSIVGSQGNAEGSAVLRRAARAAHEAVLAESERSKLRRGMGTTLSALLIGEREAWIAHVGDSRIYRLREPDWRQLTLDHSIVAERVRAGLMSAEEAEFSPQRNFLTRALGTQPDPEFEFLDIDIRPGDRFLLCSDGLWSEVEDGLIRIALQDRTHSLEQCCRELLERALSSGGRDNISLVLVEVSGARPC